MIRQIPVFLLLMTSYIGIAQNLNYDDWIESSANHSFSKLSVWRYNLDTFSNRNEIEVILSGKQEFDDTTLFSVEHYNKDGYIMRTKGYNGYHYNFEITTYEYDSIGRVIEKKDYSRDSVLKSKTQITFNDRSKNVLQEVYSNGKLKEYAISQYSSQGFLLLTKMYSTNARLEFYQTSILDNDTLKIMKVFDGDSTLDLYLVYHLDNALQLVESSILESDSSFSQGTYYQYNLDGGILFEKWVVGGGAIREQIKYEYDPSSGQLSRKTTFDSGVVYSVAEYESGVLRTEKIYNKEGGAVTLFVYQYE